MACVRRTKYRRISVRDSVTNLFVVWAGLERKGENCHQTHHLPVPLMVVRGVGHLLRRSILPRRIKSHLSRWFGASHWISPKLASSLTEDC